MKFRVYALTAILMALHVSAFAVDGGSVIGGIYSGFLKKDKSPYLVKETLIVPEGKALVVEAGVEVRFAKGTGLDVRGGSMAVMGELNNPVVFDAEQGTEGSWNGVSVTGIKRSDVQGMRLQNAEFGFAVESGALEMRDVVIDGARRAAIYVRNASVDVQWCKIQNSKNVGIWATQSATVNIDGTTFDQNHIALTVTDGADVNLQTSKVIVNDVAILDLGDNRLKQRNTLIQNNLVGIAARDIPSAEMKSALKKNEKNLEQNIARYIDELGEEPLNPHADGTKLTSLTEMNKPGLSWDISGNVGVALGHHQVFMKHHHQRAPYVSDEDSVFRGDRYVNYFQVPGFFANWNASLVMESSEGKTFEFSADVSNDEWNQFDVHTLQAIYTDQYQRLALGNVYVNAGALYLAGVNLFGGSYELNLFENSAKEPLFVGSAFAGEYSAPKIVGERNYDVYKDYVDDGEAEAQEMVAGAKVRWNMHRRFNGTLGFIGSKDYVEDPFLRDGMSVNTNTASPIVSSHNFFADGNWLFFPGDVKLNGQVAVGAADTTNAAKIRAINQVFSQAGLNSSNFALLNKLMKNPNDVNSLSSAQLESIYGENSMKTDREKRDELKRLLAEASEVAKSTKVEDTKPGHADFWGYEHWAVFGAYEWSSDNTFIEGFFRYVGREYYSSGSPDLLQNTRMIGGNLRQKIFDFWKLTFGYTMNVENADDGNGGYNIFGMGEGTEWGLFSGADDDWLEVHEQDENRTLYIHDAYLGNEFKLSDKIGLAVKYSVNYRTRSTSQRLFADYSAASGIYDDPWFQAKSGKPTLDVYENGDTLRIDSARWAKYYRLADEEYLATQFDERLLKHTAELGLTVKLPNNVLRVGGVWIYRTDLSKFVQDELLDGFDFEDKTFGILGYYFHGGDFFEQRYPISLTTTLDGFRNMFAVTPRYKSYNRNNMSEFEWALSDNMTIPLSRDFLELSLNGSVRQNFLSYEESGEDKIEMELDVDAAASLRVRHSSTLYTDWTVGSIFNYRPDSRADEYKDLFFIVSLNYEF